MAPVFQSSRNVSIICWAATFGVAVISAVYIVESRVAPAWDIILPFSVVAAICLYNALEGFFAPLRVARFFNDRAEFSGWHLKRSVAYSEIRVVESSSRPFPVLRIRLKGDNRLLSLSRTPKIVSSRHPYTLGSQRRPRTSAEAARPTPCVVRALRLTVE